MSDNKIVKINDVIARLPVEDWDVAKLIPYEKNAKIHDRKHIELLAKSIKAEGLQESILIEEDGTIVTGHGRTDACKLLNFETAPVRVLRDFTKAQSNIIRISNNQTVSNKTDSLLLRDSLDEIIEIIGKGNMDYLADATGLTERDMDILMEDVSDMTIDLDSFNQPTTEPSPEPTNEAPEKEDSLAIAKVFGFNKLTSEESRVVRMFLATADIKTGSEFAKFCSECNDSGLD
jgi:hypothetical protein